MIEETLKCSLHFSDTRGRGRCEIQMAFCHWEAPWKIPLFYIQVNEWNIPCRKHAGPNAPFLHQNRTQLVNHYGSFWGLMKLQYPLSLAMYVLHVLAAMHENWIIVRRFSRDAADVSLWEGFWLAASVRESLFIARRSFMMWERERDNLYLCKTVAQFYNEEMWIYGKSHLSGLSEEWVLKLLIVSQKLYGKFDKISLTYGSIYDQKLIVVSCSYSIFELDTKPLCDKEKTFSKQNWTGVGMNSFIH